MYNAYYLTHEHGYLIASTDTITCWVVNTIGDNITMKRAAQQQAIDLAGDNGDENAISWFTRSITASINLGSQIQLSSANHRIF